MAFGANTSEPAMVNTEPLHHPTGGYELWIIISVATQPTSEAG